MLAPPLATLSGCPSSAHPPHVRQQRRRRHRAAEELLEHLARRPLQAEAVEPRRHPGVPGRVARRRTGRAAARMRARMAAMRIAPAA